MNPKNEENMKTQEQKDCEAYEWVMNAKTPEERIKRTIKNFKKDDKISSVILYLAPAVVDVGKSTIMFDTLDDDFGTLKGQLQMDMMTNVQFRTFLMEVVDGYRDVRCPDDLIEDAFYYCGKHDKWCELTEKDDGPQLTYMRLVAGDNNTTEQKKWERLRAYINQHYKDGKEVEA